MPFIEPIRNFYGRFERPISSLSLIAGFVFDALTLKRVDTLWENIWILGHLIIVGIFILLIHLHEREYGAEKDPSKAHFWYVNILQFFFGGILSTYLVFYFRSADVFSTWPFIIVLGLAFWANESLKRHYVRFSFQVTLFFLSIYSFMIFLLPVVTHKIGALIFLVSGILSLLMISLFIWAVFYFTRDRFEESKKLIIFLVAGIFLVVNFLYFTNLIPPIPLSLKDAGVYYSVLKNSDGNYEAKYADYGWKSKFKFYPDFVRPEGAPVYIFSAVFSPKNLNITILHEWQHYDEDQNKWITEKVISLPVYGGRDGGFRTYSTRSNLSAGKWRVNIETERGQTIGRVRFNIVPSYEMPELRTVIK